MVQEPKGQSVKFRMNVAGSLSAAADVRQQDLRPNSRPIKPSNPDVMNTSSAKEGYADCSSYR